LKGAGEAQAVADYDIDSDKIGSPLIRDRLRCSESLRSLACNALVFED
jgi:hypothetical protein